MSEARTCQHCRRPIVPPRPGSYPPAVRWVHIESPVGKQNRYCELSISGLTADPARQREAS